MLEYRREMYDEVEQKFLIQGKKYSVYVNGINEINELIRYLKYDFVTHQSRKISNNQQIQDTEFVVSCNNKLSLVADYPTDRMLGFFNTFEENKKEALPLFVFIDKNAPVKYPEYFI